MIKTVSILQLSPARLNELLERKFSCSILTTDFMRLFWIDPDGDKKLVGTFNQLMILAQAEMFSLLLQRHTPTGIILGTVLFILRPLVTTEIDKEETRFHIVFGKVM